MAETYKENNEKLHNLIPDSSNLSDDDLRRLLEGNMTFDDSSITVPSDSVLFSKADEIRRENYGDEVYIRGLIEITNYCANDCFYCGIRKSNGKLQRYRLDKDAILNCCRTGYDLGFRTFVLQGGEDPCFTDDILCDIVSSIHGEYPDCAITLSAGERSKDSYRKLFEAGGRRYLLRHEAASPELYAKLHPESMSLDNRKRCLYDLRDVGFQIGAGLMAGAPFQKTEHLIEDLRFMEELQPDMIGIGPFMHHVDTPFGGFPDGTAQLTLRMVALSRIMFPYALIPSTTALASITADGRVRGLKAGANVIMPNLSPADCREKYSIYNNKAATGLESAQSLENLKASIAAEGYRIVTDIGDVKR